MKSYKITAMTALAAFGLFFSASSAASFEFPELAPQSTVDACVAEIADRAQYDDAARVRHEIESKARRTVGHVLKISTLVYGPEEGQPIREYATWCVVGVGEKPVRFEMTDKGNQAYIDSVTINGK